MDRLEVALGARLERVIVKHRPESISVTDAVLVNVPRLPRLAHRLILGTLRPLAQPNRLAVFSIAAFEGQPSEKEQEQAQAQTIGKPLRSSPENASPGFPSSGTHLPSRVRRRTSKESSSGGRQT